MNPNDTATHPTPTTKRELLLDIEPPPIDWQQAATSHLRRIGELMRERDAAEASRDRLRRYADELEDRVQDEDTTFPVVTREAHIADARKQAGIQPGDLDGEGEG